MVTLVLTPKLDQGFYDRGSQTLIQKAQIKFSFYIKT